MLRLNSETQNPKLQLKTLMSRRSFCLVTGRHFNVFHTPSWLLSLEGAMETKRCAKCKKDKLISDFRIEVKRGKPYIRFMCRECDRVFLRENYPRYKKNMKESRRKYLENNPWLTCYFNTLKRCKQKRYKYYHGKGIKNFLTIECIKYLWFRDKAYEMEKPNIHRINHNGHYSESNCMFVEARLHMARAVIQMDFHNNIIKKFESVRRAAKEVGTGAADI